MPEHNEITYPEELVAILTDETARTPQEVFRRCEAIEQLSASGVATIDALPAIMRSLLVPVSVDCVLALRVAAAEAAWKVGRRHDLAPNGRQGFVRRMAGVDQLLAGRQEFPFGTK